MAAPRAAPLVGEEAVGAEARGVARAAASAEVGALSAARPAAPSAEAGARSEARRAALSARAAASAVPVAPAVPPARAARPAARRMAGPVREVEAPYPADLISDFEDVAAATVVMAGTPPRNGIWYVNDNPALSCVQMPRPAWQTQAVGLPPERYIGVEPPGGVHAGSTGSRALRGWWTGCTIGAAGIGADFNLPMVPDGGIYMGPKVPYDVTPYKGVTFWARAAIGSDTALRIKFPMVDETKVEDGGHCSESALSKCGDSFGTKFTTPVDGSWKQFTVRWTDAAFSQEGWGKPFTWRPEAVTSIQIVPVYADQTYDFYVDDISFIH